MSLRLALVFCLCLTACAGSKDPLIATLESEREPSCAHKAVLDVRMVLYPDGVSRKSEVLQCTDGCFQAVPEGIAGLTLKVCGIVL